MSMFIDDDRFSHGMSTEMFHPWHGEHLEDIPLQGVDGIGGNVSVITVGEDRGMSYELAEPVGDNWHLVRHSGPHPGTVRPA
jgi:hypothetical protein